MNNVKQFLTEGIKRLEAENERSNKFNTEYIAETRVKNRRRENTTREMKLRYNFHKWSIVKNNKRLEDYKK
ncbi:MAG: hypothetical protein U9R08_01055 [Nanoarchaeota archaeon]|nr:hypothetical protein [Nanoarchaeota archaeon]